MNLLGLETSSTVGSVAVETPGGTLVREIATPREQTAQILALIDELLREAGIGLPDLDGIAFGRGPGSFTGLRVSVAVAQGLAAVAGMPLLPVSSLLCLAERAWREHGCERALVCVDAHMGEVYWAHDASGAAASVGIAGDERLGAPSDVTPPAAVAAPAWFAVGSGFAAHADALAAVRQTAAQRPAGPRALGRRLVPPGQTRSSGRPGGGPDGRLARLFARAHGLETQFLT